MSGATKLIDALRLERLRLRMKQGELARRVGCAQPTLCAWESGRVAPSLESARAWLDALGVAHPVELGVWFRPQVAPCGTLAGYTRHRRLKEPYCDACRAANTAMQADYRAKKRADR